ncbi:MAG: hypothetical protein A2Y33_05675 [Spirochaetes bacterium GWF1_51_8]|nr:MAG: hypothetical protein A2Y33_05675 [Spirochaetes bacterium GWF1_51_8]
MKIISGIFTTLGGLGALSLIYPLFGYKIVGMPDEFIYSVLHFIIAGVLIVLGVVFLVLRGKSATGK